MSSAEIALAKQVSAVDKNSFVRVRMGNKKKIDKWLPANFLRIKAFYRALASRVSSVCEPKPSDILDALYYYHRSIDMAETTLRAWRLGEDWPKAKNIELVELEFPGCAAWLNPTIDSTPILRFLCALDIWGSPIDSSSRKLELTPQFITAGSCLAVLEERWAPIVVMDEDGSNCGFAIPRLKCYIPKNLSATIYQSNNPISLIDFMFRCGAHIEFSKDDEFEDWAIDLASLTLVVSSFMESLPLNEKFLSGGSSADDHSLLTYNIFFKEMGDWPNLKSIRRALEIPTDFENLEIDFPKRLMLARDILKNALFAIGADLSIAETLFERVKDNNKMWQSSVDARGKSFAKGDVVRVKRKLTPFAPGQYKYEVRNFAGEERSVLFRDMMSGAEEPLPKRPDLCSRYTGSYNWGYSGEGPTFLTISILAHHLGHDDFGVEEIHRLLDKYISRISHSLLGPFILTTELIDECIN